MKATRSWIGSSCRGQSGSFNDLKVGGSSPAPCRPSFPLDDTHQPHCLNTHESVLVYNRWDHFIGCQASVIMNNRFNVHVNVTGTWMPCAGDWRPLMKRSVSQGAKSPMSTCRVRSLWGTGSTLQFGSCLMWAVLFRKLGSAPDRSRWAFTDTRDLKTWQGVKGGVTFQTGLSCVHKKTLFKWEIQSRVKYKYFYLSTYIKQRGQSSTGWSVLIRLLVGGNNTYNQIRVFEAPNCSGLWTTQNHLELPITA